MIEVRSYSSGESGRWLPEWEKGVEITHVPTGTVVRCDKHDSPHRNKQEALRVLYSIIDDKASGGKND